MNPPKNTKRTCGNKVVVMKVKGSRKGIGFLASGPVSLAYFLVASLGFRQRFTSFADKHGKILTGNEPTTHQPEVWESVRRLPRSRPK